MDMQMYAGGESNYLKASDIKGRTPTVTIGKVELVEFDNNGVKDRKPAIFFNGKDKGVVLNKTNTKGLIEGFGAESESWVGKDVMLSVVNTEMGDGIRVTALQPKTDDLDDDIPFAFALPALIGFALAVNEVAPAII